MRGWSQQLCCLVLICKVGMLWADTPDITWQISEQFPPICCLRFLSRSIYSWTQDLLNVHVEYVRRLLLAISVLCTVVNVTWIHIGCCGVSPKEYRHLHNSNVIWFCTHFHCQIEQIPALTTAPYSDPNPYGLLSDSASDTCDTVTIMSLSLQVRANQPLNLNPLKLW